MVESVFCKVVVDDDDDDDDDDDGDGDDKVDLCISLPEKLHFFMTLTDA